MSINQFPSISIEPLPIAVRRQLCGKSIARLILCSILLAILILWILLFPQTGDGDAIMHYLNAHDSLWQPAKLMGSWARWGSKMPLILPAQFGVRAARIMAALISVICAWQTIRLAEDLKIPHANLAAIFLIFQPFVFSLAGDTMTELPFALGVVIAIRLWMADRLWASCWVMGYLPTVRPEGFFLCALWGLMILARGKWKWIPLLAWGTLVWFLGCWLLWHDPTYFFRAGWAWPADSLREYGRGSFFAHINRWPIYCGPILLILFLAGVWNFMNRPSVRSKDIFWAGAAILVLELLLPPWMREHLLPWPTMFLAAALAWRVRHEKFAPAIWILLLIFALHSILWWQGWFASCGLMRILACAAPITAIVCLIGWNTVDAWIRSFRLVAGESTRTEEFGPWQAVGILAIVATAMAYYIVEPMHQRIFPLEKVSAFIADHDLLHASPMIVFGDPMAQAALNMHPNPPNLVMNDCNRSVELTHLLAAPIGSVGLWDNQHAEQWFGVSLSELKTLGYTTLYTATNRPRVAIEWLEPANSPREQIYVVIRKDSAGSMPQN